MRWTFPVSLTLKIETLWILAVGLFKCLSFTFISINILFTLYTFNPIKRLNETMIILEDGHNKRMQSKQIGLVFFFFSFFFLTVEVLRFIGFHFKAIDNYEMVLVYGVGPDATNWSIALIVIITSSFIEWKAMSHNSSSDIIVQDCFSVPVAIIWLHKTTHQCPKRRIRMDGEGWLNMNRDGEEFELLPIKMKGNDFIYLFIY